MVGFKLLVTFADDVGRYICVIKLELFFEGLEWMLQAKNVSLIHSVHSCDDYVAVVPVL